MHAPLAVVWRLLAFVGKELVETVRRPGALVSLVLGPFLIMAIFGLGFSGVRRPLETLIVIPSSSQLPRETEPYQELAGPPLQIVEIVDDRTAAEQRLEAREIDLIIVAPEDLEGAFRSGQRSTIEVVVDETDPVDENYAGILGNALADAVNRRLIEQVVEQGQGYIVEAADVEAATIPADVVAAPTESRLVNRAPYTPTVTSYFGPAVLALILQHLAVTLVSMSLVRERWSGVMELFRISPVTAAEVLAGKVFAYGILGFVVAGLTAVLLVVGLGVPALADPGYLALAIGLLLLASLGLGLLIAVVSDSERQAVQLSLLVLLASVFFSGFVLDIDEFTPPVRALAYALPVTHGIQLLQDFMLRGSTTHLWQIGALAVIAAVTLLVAWFLLRRDMRTA
ncbi:MAG TPA: ABC transporter permease [Candidatus Limnocylindrales bacterium]|jgi:ABC-2 type transport system permease protein|nr:ABC transporter permease [Candidatus Limnocylindrales bacterium]